ncbi:MAG: hypothetical protein JXA07_04940 [Spirochaetes bacterium]|nr:hypothetical protein [Spirochaetota bacterium]
MKLRIVTTAAALLMMGVATAETDAPLIKATVNPQKATVGAVLDYRVNVAAKGALSLKINPPEKREFYLKKKKDAPQKKKNEADAAEEDPAQYVPVYVIHSIKKDDRSDAAMTDITVIMQLSLYHPGTWALPEIEITGADGIAIGYQVPSVEIAAVNEKGEFQEIEPPLALGGNYWRLAFLVLGLVAAGIAAFFGVRYFMKWRVERRAAPVIIPPIRIFLKEIEAFAGETLIADGKIEEFVFGISMIFRKFLSLQFGFDATDMTTREIEKKIRKIFPAALHDAHYDEIMGVFNLWDLSKFAEFTPSAELLRSSLDRTVALARKLSGGEGDGTA